MRSPSPDDLAGMVGQRVVVRHRLRTDETAGPAGTGPGATDVIGVLEAVDGPGLVVRTATGASVPIALVDVIAARTIPVRAVPRRDVRDLESAALLGWQAAEVARNGGWLLRASHGFTGRGNSVLPLAAPAEPVDDAVATVRQWYGARGLRPAFQVIEPLGAEVTSALDRLGWPPAADRTVVMTAALGRLPTDPTGVTIRIDDRPDDAWLGQYHYRGGPLPPTARQIIRGTGSTGPATLGFAAVRLDRESTDDVAAIARGAITRSPAGRVWLGVTAVEVAPEHRRRGLATAVMAALATWAHGLDATDCYVQVATENVSARHTYAALGFTEHHHYHYRRSTEPG